MSDCIESIGLLVGILKGPVKLSDNIFRDSKMSDIRSIVSGEKAYPLKSKQVQTFSFFAGVGMSEKAKGG